MRTSYEQAAEAQGWVKADISLTHSEWTKDGKRLLVENGDRVSYSYDGVMWTPFGVTARKRFLLRGQ